MHRESFESGCTLARTWTFVNITGMNFRLLFRYIGLEVPIQNKRAAGRPKDVGDLPFLLEALK